MTKTRRQTPNTTIKNENEEHKNVQRLHSVKISTTDRSKITKRKASKSKSNPQPAHKVKAEPDTGTDSPPKGQEISQQQINQLIDCVVNNKMSVPKASFNVKMSYATGRYYYNIYKNDPEKKIPLPRNQLGRRTNGFSQEQIAALIKYIDDDGMSMQAASIKANLNYVTAVTYYNKYLEDPNHDIPIPINKKYPEDQVNTMIGYITSDKMNLMAAAKKANMSCAVARKHYLRFLNHANEDTSRPNIQSVTSGFHVTQDQINTLIHSIVDDKMTIQAATKKASMCHSSGSKYYQKYLNDHRIPTPRFKDNTGPGDYTQDQIKKLITYIVDDNMSLCVASKKANMTRYSAEKYCRQYLNDPNRTIPSPRVGNGYQFYTDDHIKQFIGYIVDDKMTIKAASKKASMSYTSGQKHYHKYFDDQKRTTSTAASQCAASDTVKIDPDTDKRHDETTHRCTQKQIDQLIHYIVNDKMTITAASKKANMSLPSGSKYFQHYLNSHARPTHLSHSCSKKLVAKLISSIVDDKMSVTAASKKANVSRTCAYKYYNRYLKGRL
jgi:transposase